VRIPLSFACLYTFINRLTLFTLYMYICIEDIIEGNNAYMALFSA